MHTETHPLLQQTLAQIAIDIPGATALLRQHKLDFCCNGQRSLAQACAERSPERALDLAALLAGLEALQQASAPAAPSADPAQLIDHILQRYHDTHRQQLPELVRMARRVEAVHAQHPAAPVGLADFLEFLQAELEQHMAKEEQILFPMLRSGGHPMICGPIGVMRHEHTEHGANLERLAALTQQHTAPAGACTTWRALYAGTERLVEDLMQHIHLENNLLFPQFER